VGCRRADARSRSTKSAPNISGCRCIGAYDPPTLVEQDQRIGEGGQHGLAGGKLGPALGETLTRARASGWSPPKLGDERIAALDSGVACSSFAISSIASRNAAKLLSKGRQHDDQRQPNGDEGERCLAA